MQARTYLTLLLVLTLLGFSGAAAFNYVIDPYRFFDSQDRPGINAWRNRFFFGQYVSKPYALREQAPNAVILGVSRAGSSMAVDHAGWGDSRVYNYAMAGSTAYLIWRNYQHARASGDLSKVVLMLDFYMYNVYINRRPLQGHVRDYEERLAVTPDFTANHGFAVRKFKDVLTSLISFEMLYESWMTLTTQNRISAGEQYKATLTPTGFWINDPVPDETQRKVFRQIERQYMSTTWFPPPYRQFSLKGEDGFSNLVFLQRIIADAHQQGIDLRIGFMPFHARLAESMRAVELWDDFERWKREVVQLVEAEAAAAGEAAYPVWDFTGYNSITTEPVPLKSDTATRMQWHLDASHVSRATGDLVQTRMLGGEGRRVPDFGQRVSSDSIDRYIESDRRARTRYAQQHVQDIKEVEQRFRHTEKWRSGQ